MLRRLLPLLLLLPLAASPAQAQGVGGDVSARFEPGSLALAVGDAGAADLVLTNGKLQPVSLTLSAQDERGLVLTLSKTSVVLAPGASDTVRVDAYPAASAGAASMTARVSVVELGVPLTQGSNRTVSLPIEISAAAPAATAARIEPAGFPDTPVAPGATALLFGNVTHADASVRTYDVRVLAPSGWTASTNATLTVHPDAPAHLRVSVTAGESAATGPGRIVLQLSSDARVARVADVWLVRANATPPANGTTPPPANGTGDPPANGTGDAGNATLPPATNGTADPPGDDAAADPGPQPEPAAADPPAGDGQAADEPAEEPAAPPPAEPRPVVLEVVPSTVDIAPGGTAQATLRATSDADRDLVVRLALPQGLGSDLTHRTLLLRAGEAFEVPFLLEADAGLENGTRLLATVASEDGAASATFEVLVVVPPPPVELTSVPTPPPPATGDQGTGSGVALAAVAAGVGGAALALLWTRKKWALALAGLYARLRPQAVLQHPMRQRMMDIVRARPGLTIRDLQRDVGLANGATMHHVRTLEKAGMLRIVEDGMLRRLYPVGHARVDPVPALSERILKAVAEKGEATPADVALAVGATRQAVHYHVQRMVREGKLRARIEGRETYLRLMPASPEAPLPRPAGT